MIAARRRERIGEDNSSVSPNPEPPDASRERKHLIIAIDGPSGAGKGTIARAVAARLPYHHVDTGAMYRAVAWKALRDGVDVNDEDATADVARRAALHVIDGVVSVDGNDVALEIRTPEIDAAATAVARLPKVRSILIVLQR